MKKFDFILLVTVLVGLVTYYREPIMKMVMPKIENRSVLKNYRMLSITSLDGNDLYPLNNEAIGFFKKNGISLEYTARKYELFGPDFYQNWDNDLGSSNIFVFNNLLNAGKKLVPIFILKSQKEKNLCTMKVNLIVKENSQLSGFKELLGKKIEVRHLRIGSGPLIMDALLKEKIKLKKITVGNKAETMSRSLDAGDVDAIIDLSGSFGDKSPFDLISMGRFSNGKFEKYPNYKIADVIDTNIPCKVLYVNQNLSQEERLNLVNLFKKAVLDNGISIGSITNFEDFPPSLMNTVTDILQAKTPVSEVAEEVVTVK